MKRYPFIFSNELKYRLQRHVTFWLCWWLFCILLYGYTPILTRVQAYERFELAAIEAFFYLAPHMFLAYSLMYFVIPKFIIKGKYFYGAIAVVVCAIIAGFISTAISSLILIELRQTLYPHWGELLARYKTNSIWLSLLAGLRGGLTIGGLAAAIKLMKYWYIKEQRNLQLQKENSESQLQLLKAQVHPHFLFNTLNNIYAHTQPASPMASKLVMGLGDLLRYMLYECNQPFVPLNKELQMIRDYVTLEKIRYGNRLDVQLNVPSDTGNLVIAPLLLLPFVENCFKHGASQMLDQPWISLQVTIENTVMKMKLVNGKAEEYQPQNTSHGIGISNVRKRLELIYPEKFELNIQEDEEVYIVNLKLNLEKSRVSKEIKQLILASADA